MNEGLMQLTPRRYAITEDGIRR